MLPHLLEFLFAEWLRSQAQPGGGSEADLALVELRTEAVRGFQEWAAGYLDKTNPAVSFGYAGSMAVTLRDGRQAAVTRYGQPASSPPSGSDLMAHAYGFAGTPAAPALTDDGDEQPAINFHESPAALPRRAAPKPGA
jgi:hypothetical protein